MQPLTVAQVGGVPEQVSVIALSCMHTRQAVAFSMDGTVQNKSHSLLQAAVASQAPEP